MNTTLEKQLAKTVSNMTVEEQAQYVHRVGESLQKELDAGKITNTEFEKRIETTFARITNPMDYSQHVSFASALHKDAVRIAIEAFNEMDRRHKMAAIVGTELALHLLEETLNHEATKSAWCEDRLYQIHPTDEAAKAVKEDIETRKEFVLPLFQGLEQVKKERAELLDPKIWEDLGGVPEVDPYHTTLSRKVERICADLQLLPDKFIEEEINS